MNAGVCAGMNHAMIETEAVVALAMEAAALLKAYYQGTIACNTKQKTDQSPVTTADIAANQLIVDGLQAKWPEIPILSEESADQPRGASCFWCVDPMDGTRGFIERNDEFAVSIALIDHGKPVMGVVWVPMRDQGYVATPAGEAWLMNQEGHKQPLRCRPWPTDGGVQLVSRHHHKPCDFEGITRHQPMGSALKGCVIAQGQADLYWREGPTSWWDTAAFQCVVEAAGGGVFDRQGLSLTYQWDRSLCNPSFLVLGDCQRLRQCLRNIRCEKT